MLQPIRNVLCFLRLNSAFFCWWCNAVLQNSTSAAFLSTSFKRPFQLDEFLDTSVHVLDALDLRLAETTLVGDVVDSAGRLRVLAVDTARLDLVLVADLFEIGVRRGMRDFDVDACAHARAEVGRT